MSSPRPTPEAHAGDDGTAHLIRWAAFSCVLVPVVLLWYGASLAGAAGTALGLAAVTAVCRLLLRRSERCAARQSAEDRGAGPGAPRVPHAPRPGHRQRPGTGSHRGGRHSGGSAPVG
ncbi:hypothetical protein ACH4F6_07230 [Streptomyces sp. NPDC017936]|uniref:hypothetical protein n=1 Tax=Streptomyces sp. NPDC017936 TaxID=3365016 RepID=UPI00379F4EE2